jgi:type IV secretory pathway VirB10-like protein
MTGESETKRAEAPPVDPENAVKLRGDPPRVMRLSRKAIGTASACGFAVVGGALIYALQPERSKSTEELFNTDSIAVADNLAGAPKDYGDVPRLGPPMPGDLGKPILDAQRRGDIAALPPIGAQPTSPAANPAANAAEVARQRAEQEREAGRARRATAARCRRLCKTCGRAADRCRQARGIPQPGG